MHLTNVITATLATFIPCFSDEYMNIQNGTFPSIHRWWWVAIHSLWAQLVFKAWAELVGCFINRLQRPMAKRVSWVSAKVINFFLPDRFHRTDNVVAIMQWKINSKSRFFANQTRPISLFILSSVDGALVETVDTFNTSVVCLNLDWLCWRLLEGPVESSCLV